MDTLRLKGLKFRGMHGVFEHEKQNGNDFEVDILIRTSLRTSAYSDDLSDTIYHAVNSPNNCVAEEITIRRTAGDF